MHNGLRECSRIEVDLAWRMQAAAWRQTMTRLQCPLKHKDGKIKSDGQLFMACVRHASSGTLSQNNGLPGLLTIGPALALEQVSDDGRLWLAGGSAMFPI